MEKEFVPYEQALELKELGFDEECLDFYDDNKELFYNHENKEKIHIGDSVKAPLYQQAFTWFREKYGLYGYPFSQMSQTNFWFKYFIQQEWKDQITSDGFITHEEAELECLKKLIEIVKEK